MSRVSRSECDQSQMTVECCANNDLVDSARCSSSLTSLQLKYRAEQHLMQWSLPSKWCKPLKRLRQVGGVYVVEGAITIPFSRDGEVSVDMALGRRLGIMNSCQMTAHLSAFVDRSYRAFSEPDDMIARLTTRTHTQRETGSTPSLSYHQTPP